MKTPAGLRRTREAGRKQWPGSQVSEGFRKERDHWSRRLRLSAPVTLARAPLVHGGDEAQILMDGRGRAGEGLEVSI